MKFDMFGQPMKEGDYVCCTSSRGSTGMYIGKITKFTEHKVQLFDTKGSKHMKSFNKVFVVTEQINTIPELMI